MEESDIEFSVVIADAAVGRSIDAALGIAAEACEGLSFELIVAGPPAAPDRPVSSRAGRDVRYIERPAGTLTPVLWGAGASVARGRVVAFTSTQMLLARGWGGSLNHALRDNIVGVAGAIGLAPDAGGATAALYFVRFSAFLPESHRTGATTLRDIPGDNAAYLRAAVLRHEDLLAEGFWEVEFHRRFERDGLRLSLVQGAEATMMAPVDFVAAARQRFAHAASFGDSRVGRHGESVGRVVLAAPIVPFLLVLRIGRRVLPHARYRLPFFVSLPWLLGLSVAWAAGEAVGAVRAGRRTRGRTP